MPLPKEYVCTQCNRWFILDMYDISLCNSHIKIPYCPYCGRKTNGGLSGYEPTIKFIRKVKLDRHS